jgi:hypothetical protein
LKTHYRGSAINFETVFTTTSGTILQVTAATLTVQHPLDGFPLWNGTHTTSYSLTNTSTVTGTWEYNWDSSACSDGPVSWYIAPASTVAMAKQGRFYVKSGPAATWLYNPSSVAANDEMTGSGST